MSSGDTAKRLERFVASNPDASPIEVLARLGLDPDEWKDTADQVVQDVDTESVSRSSGNGGFDVSDKNNQVENTTDSDESRRSTDGDGGPTDSSKIPKPTNRPLTPPAPLADLGEVFVPIPPREKGTHRPRTPENLYAADDPVLEAYLEAGHNYGIACRGDIAVVDADDPEQLHTLLDALPTTVWQVSGSRSSEHYFLQVDGLDEDLPLIDPESGDELGHIKAAEQSYVVGPGSIHPSGNRYGPLQGDTIATLSESTLRELIDPFRPEENAREQHSSPIDRDHTSGGSDVDLDVYDVISRGSYPEDRRVEHPLHGSDTGANFMVDGDGDTFRCWRHGCTGNALHLVGIDEDVIDCGDWKGTGLDTDTWREIFAAAREAGYDLPEFDPGGEPTAVLPGDDVLPPVTAWDWREAGGRAAGDDSILDVDGVRERTVDAIADGYERGDRRLVEALPTLGKSYGAIAAAARTGEQITYLTGRGRKEQYEQVAQWCREHGLTYKVLPAFTRDCPTATGEHGEDWKVKVRDWYRRGATPQDIHKYAEDVLGRPLPCQVDDDGNHVDCPYAHKWAFDPETDGSADPDEEIPVDVLIGHYTHAHREDKVVHGRTVVFDEFPAGTYERQLGHGIEGAVSYHLACDDAIPFDDYTELLEARDDDERRGEALAKLLDRDLAPDGRAVLEESTAHAAAPLAAFTILAAAGGDLGNGWERAEFPGDDGRIGLRDRRDGVVRILSPPNLSYASGVVALDGTPTKELWELTLGEPLNRRRILSDAERREYISKGLNLNIVRTTEWLKPYNSADHVNVADDVALLEAICDRHDEKPGVITTRTALEEYEREAVLAYNDDTGEVLDGPADHVKWYGDVLGSNEFKHKRAGALLGSTHYGDGFIQKWGAYAGEVVERNDEKGADLSYGGFGDKVLTHMREHSTLQAAMRFGRDGEGAVVYVHTDTLPEWVPIAGEGRVVRPRSSGERQVLDVIEGCDYWTTDDVADDPEVEVSQRRVRQILDGMADDGVLEKGQSRDDGRAVEWSDGGIEALPDHVELPEVDVEAGVESCGNMRRKTIYTWISATTPGDDSQHGGDADGEELATDGGREKGGEPPPDDPD